MIPHTSWGNKQWEEEPTFWQQELFTKWCEHTNAGYFQEVEDPAQMSNRRYTQGFG